MTTAISLPREVRDLYQLPAGPMRVVGTWRLGPPTAKRRMGVWVGLFDPQSARVWPLAPISVDEFLAWTGQGGLRHLRLSERIEVERLVGTTMPEPSSPWLASCSSGCGCIWGDDPDRRECACDGECCFDDAWSLRPSRSSEAPFLTEVCWACGGSGGALVADEQCAQCKGTGQLPAGTAAAEGRPEGGVAEALPERRTLVRWRCCTEGGHVHVRVFCGKGYEAEDLGHTLAKAGDLVFGVEEWPEVRAQALAAGWAVVPEEVA